MRLEILLSNGMSRDPIITICIDGRAEGQLRPIRRMHRI